MDPLSVFLASAVLAIVAKRKKKDVVLVPVDLLWRSARSNWCDVLARRGKWGSGLSPESILRPRLPRGIDPGAAEYDIGSVQFWSGRFEDYVGRETEIPVEYAIVAFEDEGRLFIEDGFHRLAAAKGTGLRSFPVEISPAD